MASTLTILEAVDVCRVLLADFEKCPVEIQIFAIGIPVLCGWNYFYLAIAV
jgi:hypothetical protein